MSPTDADHTKMAIAVRCEDEPKLMARLYRHLKDEFDAVFLDGHARVYGGQSMMGFYVAIPTEHIDQAGGAGVWSELLKKHFEGPSGFRDASVSARRVGPGFSRAEGHGAAICLFVAGRDHGDTQRTQFDRTIELIGEHGFAIVEFDGLQREPDSDVYSHEYVIVSSLQTEPELDKDTIARVRQLLKTLEEQKMSATAHRATEVWFHEDIHPIDP